MAIDMSLTGKPVYRERKTWKQWSMEAEQRFRQRVQELGGTLVYEQWEGTHTPHHVICAEGHDAYPRPGHVQQGQGICKVCAGRDSIYAEMNFRYRVAELGGHPAYEQWEGVERPHHIVCAEGHDAYPYPKLCEARWRPLPNMCW